jgi:hypothetical protein
MGATRNGRVEVNGRKCLPPDSGVWNLGLTHGWIVDSFCLVALNRGPGLGNGREYPAGDDLDFHYPKDTPLRGSALRIIALILALLKPL